MALWILGAGCVLSFVLSLHTFYQALHVLHLSKMEAPELSAWPTLSVIIPACDEVDTMEAALQSILVQDYPDLEVIAIDDRSTDGTGALLDRMAEAHPTLRVLHITELPTGWLGKLNAMQVGTELATGEFLLYMDADVHLTPGALRRAMAWVVADSLDHLTLVPRMVTDSLWLEAVIQSMGGAYINKALPSQMNRDRGRSFGGVGAFNLVRRARYDDTPGWPWLRMEVIDDMALGYMMREVGGRCRIAFAPEDVSVRWYPSVPALIRGLDKGLFGTMGYRVGAALVMIPMITFLSVAPLAILMTPWWWLGLGVMLTSVLASCFVLPRETSLFACIAGPLCFIVLALMMARSISLVIWAGGITWRGTFYPLRELREMSRIGGRPTPLP